MFESSWIQQTHLNIILWLQPGIGIDSSTWSQLFTIQLPSCSDGCAFSLINTNKNNKFPVLGGNQHPTVPHGVDRVRYRITVITNYSLLALKTLGGLLVRICLLMPVTIYSFITCLLLIVYYLCILCLQILAYTHYILVNENMSKQIQQMMAVKIQRYLWQSPMNVCLVSFATSTGISINFPLGITAC